MQDSNQPFSKEYCSERINELSQESVKQIRIPRADWDREAMKKVSDELDELLDYRKIQWPDDYDERVFARVNDDRAIRSGEIGQVGYVSHNEVGVTFPDGAIHYYHDMSLKKVKSSPELRAIWGEIPKSQYFKKENKQ
jgi:hypothetical protein